MTKRSYSYSMLQSAYRCNKLFKLLYVDKIKPEVPSSGDMAFGTAVHAGVQAILEGDNGQQVFETFWASEKGQDRRYGRFSWKDLQRQGEVLLARFSRIHAKKFKIFKMEERIYSKLEGISLEGTPDFVGEFEGVPSVVDFKTSGSLYTADKLICNQQLPLYAHMAQQEWNYKVEQIVYCVLVKGTTPNIQILKLPLDKQSQEATLKSIVEICQELNSRQVWPENRSGCLMGSNRCDFWSVCFPSK